MRNTIKLFNITIRRFSHHSELGGRSVESFRTLCENSSKFIKEVLSPKIINVEKGLLTMRLTYKKDFIGNPLIPCLHGGIAASMLDHTACFCAWTLLSNTQQYLVTSGLLLFYIFNFI